ncbi:MAG: hypothetical protein OXU74_07765 [Gemmatimonadota bacterium]|nr:hypothetical protein [Gemmatimonadota bacterium]
MIYPRWTDRLSLDYDGRYADCDDVIGISIPGVLLHEFGHALADPLVGCTEQWRKALIEDREQFPSIYALVRLMGYHPDRSRATCWECMDYPPVDAVEGDTIPSGGDIGEFVLDVGG